MTVRIPSSTMLLLLLAACTPSLEESRVSTKMVSVQTEEVSITPDVVYGHTSGLALTFDVYRPPNANGTAVIFVVSGGWRSSWEMRQFELRPDRNPRLLTVEELKLKDPQPLLAEFSFRPLLSSGFTVFAVRHGSSPKFEMSEIVVDLRSAVRFIRHYADDYGIDEKRIGVWGGSAGGHLSLLLGATGDSGQPGATTEFERAPSQVAAVVAYFPPSDLRRLTDSWTPELRNRFPAAVLEDDEYKEYSPLHFASSDDAPTLIIHGDKDELVPIVEGESMHQALLKVGVTSSFVTIPGAGHGFVDEDANQAAAEMLSWFEKHLAVE